MALANGEPRKLGPNLNSLLFHAGVVMTASLSIPEFLPHLISFVALSSVLHDRVVEYEVDGWTGINV